MIQRAKSRFTIVNHEFVEIHKYFRSEEDWKRFLEDPRVMVPPIAKEVRVIVLALPQFWLEKFRSTITNSRVYIPREMLKRLKGWPVELVIRIEPRK